MLTIVVTYHRRASLLRLCLESLHETVSQDVEIIVVMNNANEHEISDDFRSANVRFIRVMETLGYAGAANLGAAAARGDHIVFVDYDIVFTKGWLAALLATHLSSATIGATGCCIVDPHSGRVLDFGIGFTRFNSPHPHMDHRVGSPLVSRSRPVQALCTAAFVITKELFIEVGGFDPVFASLYTDIDLCLRLKAIGRECWVSASAIVYHF